MIIEEGVLLNIRLVGLNTWEFQAHIDKQVIRGRTNRPTINDILNVLYTLDNSEHKRAIDGVDVGGTKAIDKIMAILHTQKETIGFDYILTNVNPIYKEDLPMLKEDPDIAIGGYKEYRPKKQSKVQEKDEG